MFLFLHKWHKRIGISVALFVIGLVVSGIALNHSHEFRLSENYIQLDWLLNLYEIKPVNSPIAYEVENNWVVKIDERLYFNKQEIAQNVEKLFGLVKLDQMYVISFDDKLLLLTKQGALIERLSGAEGVPSGMRAIGLDESGSVVIRAAHGDYITDLNNLGWQEFDHLDANWSMQVAVPADLQKDLMQAYRGRGLTLERIILDFHSGRILGQWGVYLVDLVAIFFLLLALSGCWMWWQTYR